MIGRPLIVMTGLAICSSGSLVIENSISPGGGSVTGGTLTCVMISRPLVVVTGLAIRSSGCLVIERSIGPGGGGVAG